MVLLTVRFWQVSVSGYQSSWVASSPTTMGIIALSIIIFSFAISLLPLR